MRFCLFLVLILIQSISYARPIGNDTSVIICDDVKISRTANDKKLEIEIISDNRAETIEFNSHKLPEEILRIKENYWCLFKVPAPDFASIYLLTQNKSGLSFEKIPFPFYEKEFPAFQTFSASSAKIKNVENRLTLSVAEKATGKIRQFYYDSENKHWREPCDVHAPLYTIETARSENPALRKWEKRIEDFKKGIREPISDFFRSRGINNPEKLSAEKKARLQKILRRRGYPESEIEQAISGKPTK